MDITPFESVAPWEKFPEETAKSYAGFIAYRNLPVHERSLKRAVISLYGKETQGKIRQFQHWSAKYQWVARSNAWDTHVDEESRRDLVEQVKSMNSRHIQVAMAMQQKVIERLRSIDSLELGVTELIHWLNTAVKIERLARGEPEEIIVERTKEGEIDFSRLPTDKLRSIVLEKKLLRMNFDEEEESE